MATTSRQAYVLFLVFLFKNNVVLCTTQDCYEALSVCNNDTKCFHKLNHYANACGTIVDTSNTSTKFPCSSGCVNAIKALMQTTKGKALWKCDCNLDADCLTLKTRTQKCLAIANGTYRKRTSCTMALNRCKDDPKCQQSQIEFLIKCSKLFSQTACTTQCLCSQKRLFTLGKGRPLMDCECDGPEELFCHGLRAQAEAMKCNWNRRNRKRRLRKGKIRCKRCRQRRGEKSCVRRNTRRSK